MQSESRQAAALPQRKVSEAPVKRVRGCRANEGTVPRQLSPCAQESLVQKLKTRPFDEGVG